MGSKNRLSLVWKPLLALSLLLAGWSPSQAAAPQEPPCPPSQGADCDQAARPGAVLFPTAPTATGGPDQFGYTWDDGAGAQSAWIDATGGTTIFTEMNNGVYQLDLPPGFNGGNGLPFYESTYTSVYVSSNGLVGFNDSLSQWGASLENLPVPLEYEFPQAFVAPFWDDLIVGGDTNDGAVYWTTGTHASWGDYLVIEWYQITKLLAVDLLTFEVVLYANGNILFQYQTLNGDLNSVTVGIEDGDGVDGLQYRYNNTGEPLAAGKDILFTRPDPSFRTKAFPLRRDAFAVGGEASFKFYVRNTGEKGNDIYELDVAPSTWGVSLYDGSSGSPLRDNTGDGKPDTNTLAQGSTFTVVVKVSAPVGAVVGAEATLNLTVISKNLPTKTRVVQFRLAVPTPFAQSYRQGNLVSTDLIAPQSRYTFIEHTEYRGSTFIMNGAGEHRYLGLWEHNEQSVPYTHLYSIMFSGTGLELSEKFQLTDHDKPENAGKEIRDSIPAAVIAPNGNIGVAWKRQVTHLTGPDTGKTNRNVFFAVLNTDASGFVQTELDVTQVMTYYAPGEPGSISFGDVRIQATADSKFVLSWTKKKDITITDIYRAVYQSNGAPLMGATVLFPENPSDSINYSDPALMDYLDNLSRQRVLLFYFVHDSSLGSPVDRLYYVVLNTNGGLEIGQTLVHEGFGYGPDAIQLSNNQVALAWTDSTQDTDRIAFKILPQSLSPQPPTQFLTNPDGRPAGFVSVTRDASGRAVFTWGDAKWSQRLYYALVGSGAILTQPLVFKYLQLGPLSGLEANGTGLGNAAYIVMYRLQLPYLRK